MKIGIDIDGVLANFTGKFEPFVKKRFGMDVVDRSKYPLKERYNTKDHLKLLYAFIMDGGYSKLQPHRDAIDFINGLNAQKIIITSRYPLDKRIDAKIRDIIIDGTTKWLSNYGIEYDKLIFSRDKAKHVYELGIDLFFEDCLDNAEAVASVVNIASFLIDRDWNRMETQKSIRLDKIDDAAKYLDLG
jgi:uncharacterized HAD superfamily protein